MANRDQNETMPLDPRTAQGDPGPPLPFRKADGQAATGVQRAVIEVSEGATRVPVALDTVVWRQDGALSLTVVVKATFSMAASPMTPAPAAEPFRSQDVHRKNQPLAHVVAASDRAPQKPRVDVTVIGSACAPKGRPVSEMQARIAVRQGGVSVLDKAVRVVGDRDASDAAPSPFTRIPITWERAYGGKIPANPIGCSGEDDDQPNVLDPANVWRPAGFGPVAAGWPLRSKRLGSVTRKQLDAFVIELPAGFDWGFFQAAPQDQQLDAIDETAVIALEGSDPERERGEAALPGPRAAGAVYGLDAASPDAPWTLDFRLDTVHVDAESWACTVVFRASVRVANESALPGLLVAAGIGVNGAVPEIPAARPSATLAPSAPVSTGGSGGATTGTLAPNSRPAGATLPFSDLALPGDRETMMLPSAPQPALPFAAEAPASPPTQEAPPMQEAPPAPPPLLGPIAPSGPAERPPEEEVDLERYAAITAVLDEPGARRSEVLSEHGVAEAVWAKAAQHWKRAMDHELKRGKPAMRDHFDDVYVASWEEEHPDRFGLPEYARIVRAERKGHLSVELSDLGLSMPLGMRLRRVWSRRVSSDAALARRLADLLAVS